MLSRTSSRINECGEGKNVSTTTNATCKRNSRKKWLWCEEKSRLTILYARNEGGDAKPQIVWRALHNFA